MVISLLIWIPAISIITAALYAWDKRAATRDNRRIPEKTLLLCSLAGGWPGGILAGQVFRHKTKKLSYRVKFLICTALNVTAIIGLLLLTR